MPPGESRSWMWIEAFETIDRAERLHRQFFHAGPPQARRPSWQPPVDLVESDDEYIILVALPGVDPAALEVGIDGTVVVIAGERPMPCDGRETLIHRLEIPYGRFERRIELPRPGLEVARREMVHGCLLLTFRKPL